MIWRHYGSIKYVDDKIEEVGGTIYEVEKNNGKTFLVFSPAMTGNLTEKALSKILREIRKEKKLLKDPIYFEENSAKRREERANDFFSKTILDFIKEIKNDLQEETTASRRIQI